MPSQKKYTNTYLTIFQKNPCLVPKLYVKKTLKRLTLKNLKKTLNLLIISVKSLPFFGKDLVTDWLKMSVNL